MQTCLPILCILLLACTLPLSQGAKAKKAINPLESRLSKLAELTKLLKEGMTTTQSAQPSSPRLSYRNKPLSPEEEEDESRERYWTRALERHLENEELDDDEYLDDYLARYEAEQYNDADEADLYYEEDADEEYLEDDDEYNGYEVQAPYPTGYPPRDQAYQYGPAPYPVQPPKYVKNAQPSYPNQYNPVAKTKPWTKNAQAYNYPGQRYEPAPSASVRPPTYTNQYQKQYRYIDSLYEPQEYEKIMEKAKYSRAQTPYQQLLNGKSLTNEVDIAEPIETVYEVPVVPAEVPTYPTPVDVSVIPVVEAEQPQEQQNTTTPAPQSSVVSIPVMTDRDIAILIESKPETETPAPASQPQADATYPVTSQPKEEGSILIPATETQSVSVTYVDSKPEEKPVEQITEVPVETAATLSRRRSKSAKSAAKMLRASKPARKNKRQHSLKELVRNYLKSKAKSN